MGKKIGLLLDCDRQVADYLFTKHVRPRMQYDAAFGIITDGVLTGGILLQSWNGFNVELSYYGYGTVTAGILRCLARLLVLKFDPARVTVTVSRKSRRVMKALPKLGFHLEGVQRRFYGNEDINRNTGVRFVMYREKIGEIAKIGVRSVSKQA